MTSASRAVMRLDEFVSGKHSEWLSTEPEASFASCRIKYIPPHAAETHSPLRVPALGNEAEPFTCFHGFLHSNLDNWLCSAQSVDEETWCQGC